MHHHQIVQAQMAYHNSLLNQAFQLSLPQPQPPQLSMIRRAKRRRKNYLERRRKGRKNTFWKFPDQQALNMRVTLDGTHRRALRYLIYIYIYAIYIVIWYYCYLHPPRSGIFHQNGRNCSSRLVFARVSCETRRQQLC